MVAQTKTDNSKNRNGSAIVKCNCSNEWQDKTYGKGMRVHNKGLKSDTCTVCGNSKAAS